MKPYPQLDNNALKNEFELVKSQYSTYADLHLSLDLTRGKPSSEQVNLSNSIMNCASDDGFIIDRIDVRNYGVLGGLPSIRALFADVLGVDASQIFIGGNASLQLMYDVISKAYTHGLLHSVQPWSKEKTIKFLCPCPGYDRHFNLSLSFGMELIPIDLTPEGPSIEQIEKHMSDPSVKGIWCVPKFSNPDGITYSKRTCEALASLQPAAPDFTIIWDNAYCIHSIYKDEPLPNMLSICQDYGCPDRVYMFMSTSKITYAGSGLALFATSENNLEYYKRLAAYQTIGYSKINEYMHLRFLKDKANLLAHMQKHAEILRPKFDAVLTALDKNISPLNIATWRRPNGGYFVSFYAMPHTASRIVELCRLVGLKLTPAGATYPYSNDPLDSNIRIAPSYPTLKEVEQAMDVLCICVRYAALEKMLESV
ncbi:MAG: aminotransferase [Eubacteriales bacterium]|nr:aminotransferase [Eubacteriales bacterium]